VEFFMSTLPRAAYAPDGTVTLQFHFDAGLNASLKSINPRHRIYRRDRRAWIIAPSRAAEAVEMLRYRFPTAEIVRSSGRPATKAAT
jgi:hypothetical protein